LWQENPDLEGAGHEDALIYKCWDANYEEESSEQQSQVELSAAGDVDSNAMDAFMRSGLTQGPSMRMLDISAGGAKLPLGRPPPQRLVDPGPVSAAAVPAPGAPLGSPHSAVGKAVGKAKAKAKAAMTDAQKALKEFNKLNKDLGECYGEVDDLSVRHGLGSGVVFVVAAAVVMYVVDAVL
jgi:hypothetical protein